MLLTQKRLCQILGILWYIDGVLQLQPQMFSTTMVNQIMVPTWVGQPVLVVTSLRWIMALMMRHIIVMNLLIAAVQLGIGFCLYTERWVKKTLLVSVVWSLLVWYGGEGMSMLLTGQATALTGAPGAVLLYPLVGFLLFLRSSAGTNIRARLQLRWILAGFWFFAALLQMQPYWWHAGNFSDLMSSMIGLGGFNGILFDPLFQWLADLTASNEILVNSILVVTFVGLGSALILVKGERQRLVLIASIVVSAMIWVIQGLGMIFTGLATDANSGALLIIIALACWYKASPLSERAEISRVHDETAHTTVGSLVP